LVVYALISMNLGGGIRLSLIKMLGYLRRRSSSWRMQAW